MSEELCEKRQNAHDPHCGTCTEWLFVKAKLPTAPGCYYRQPAVGNGNCTGPFVEWTRDDWGKQHANSDANQTSCLKRKEAHDPHCGTTTEWLFVQAAATATPTTGAPTA